MIPFIALLLFAQSAPPSCSLVRPVAADAASARRIAEAVLRNVHAPPFPYHWKRRPYLLEVEPAQDDPNAWLAFQRLDEKNIRGGGGLGFRIDRCTGAISRMAFMR